MERPAFWRSGAREGMGVYRKVDPRVWDDARFLRLSQGARLIFLHLLTGPHTTALPGLSQIGQAALAEQLRMPLESFRKAMTEVIGEGLAEADWDARVVRIRNAPRYNPPQSPNAIRGWAVMWTAIPDCELKFLHLQSLQAILKDYGQAFTEAFTEAFGEGFGKGRVRARGEQEQEQEQKEYLAHRPPAEAPGAPPGAGAPAATLAAAKTGKTTSTPSEPARTSTAAKIRLAFDEFWQPYPKKIGKKPAFATWLRLFRGKSEEQCRDLHGRILGALDADLASDQWQKDQGRFVPYPMTWLNRERWNDAPHPA